MEGPKQRKLKGGERYEREKQRAKRKQKNTPENPQREEKREEGKEEMVDPRCPWIGAGFPRWKGNDLLTGGYFF